MFHQRAREIEKVAAPVFRQLSDLGAGGIAEAEQLAAFVKGFAGIFNNSSFLKGCQPGLAGKRLIV
jgi:hypothetical protein